MASIREMDIFSAIFRHGSSVRYVEVGHNRSLGQYISRQLRGLNPGDVVRINVK